ncbi:MAG TPA: DUF4082 domain-containing protein [Gaiellaceae bacterium]|nr:DUF4082 domain-containing protein [Gaiellaceae bacterium]
MKRVIATIAFIQAFAAALSALLSSLPGVDVPTRGTVAATELPAPDGSAPPPRLPRRGGGARSRRLLVLLGVAGVALVGAAAWAFWVAGTAPGAQAEGVAATVQQVHGLTLDGGVSPTADPDVALSWNAAHLSNGLGVDGYVVRRYHGLSSSAVCGGPSATSCVDLAPDGTYDYGVAARFAGWTGPESAHVTVVVDTSAPSIDSAPQSPSANPSPTFAFSHPRYEHFACSLDAGAFATCSSPDTLDGPLGEGSHTFRVEALDAHGNATDVASTTWTIDTSPPVIGTTPADTSADTAPSIPFSHGSYSTFACDLDGTGFVPCTGPDALSALGNGQHTFSVEAFDADGIATPAASYTWTVDASPPTFTAKPTAHSANPSPSFSFVHTEASYTFKCKLDTGDLESCTSSHGLSDLPGGAHELTVEAFDADGVATAPAVYDWTVDTTPPTITSTGGMVDGGTYASQDAAFTLSHAFYSSFECGLDGATLAGCAGSGGTDGIWPSGFQASGGDCGSPDANGFCYADHSGEPPVELGVRFTTSQSVQIVGVRVYRVDDGPVTGSLWDASGNRIAGATAFAGTATHSWQDVMFPSPVAMAPGQTFVASYFAPTPSYAYQHDAFTGGGITAGPITALQSAPSALNGIYCYTGCFPQDSFRDSNYWVTPLWTTGSGGTVSYTGLADGVHTLAADALDGDGYATPTSAFHWTVEHAAPSITSHPDALTSSSSAGFSFSDDPFTHFACSLDGGAFTTCDGGSSSYTGLADGSHTFTVHAVDAIGGTTADQTFTWTVDTAAPTVDVEQANSQADAAASLPIHFTATFDEPVHAFTSGVTLGGTADTSGATVTVTQLSPTTYDIAVDGVAGSGTVTALLDAGATTDLAGNASTASTSTDDTVDYEPGP